MDFLPKLWHFWEHGEKESRPRCQAAHGTSSAGLQDHHIADPKVDEMADAECANAPTNLPSWGYAFAAWRAEHGNGD